MEGHGRWEVAARWTCPVMIARMKCGFFASLRLNDRELPEGRGPSTRDVSTGACGHGHRTDFGERVRF